MNPTEFPQIPILITRKTYPKNNILVGTDKAQIRFAEHILNLECQQREMVKDDDLLGKDEGLLLQVYSSNHIDLSSDVKKKTGIWSIHPLEGGSAGMNALVRVASEILGEKIEKEKIEAVGNNICKENEITDLRGALWEAVWQLSGDVVTKNEKWPQPWESQSWIPKNIEPSYRLNVLYRELVGYVYARDDDQPAAKRFGISNARFARLKSLSLDLAKVESSIKILSQWKNHKTSSLICALVISRIWN